MVSFLQDFLPTPTHISPVYATSHTYIILLNFIILIFCKEYKFHNLFNLKDPANGIWSQPLVSKFQLWLRFIACVLPLLWEIKLQPQTELQERLVLFFTVFKKNKHTHTHARTHKSELSKNWSKRTWWYREGWNFAIMISFFYPLCMCH
jgi:hypothetical protein